MTLEEAKKIVETMNAYLGEGPEPSTLIVDGYLTKKEIQALWVVLEAEELNIFDL